MKLQKIKMQRIKNKSVAALVILVFLLSTRKIYSQSDVIHYDSCGVVQWNSINSGKMAIVFRKKGGKTKKAIVKWPDGAYMRGGKADENCKLFHKWKYYDSSGVLRAEYDLCNNEIFQFTLFNEKGEVIKVSKFDIIF
jgi:hypothetical protein